MYKIERSYLPMEKKRFLVYSGICLLLNIPIFLLHHILLNFVLLGLATYFIARWYMYELDIMYKDCNPELFFERNKEKPSQRVNCCYALLYTYDDSKKDFIDDYLRKTQEELSKKQDSIFSTKYADRKMQLEYLQCYYLMLKGEPIQEEFQKFEARWHDLVQFNLRLKNRLKLFIYGNTNEKAILTPLEELYYQFNRACTSYQIQNYEDAYARFYFVAEKGEHLYCGKMATQYIEELETLQLNRKKIKANVPFLHKLKYYKNSLIIGFACSLISVMTAYYLLRLFTYLFTFL